MTGSSLGVKALKAGSLGAIGLGAKALIGAGIGAQAGFVGSQVSGGDRFQGTLMGAGIGAGMGALNTRGLMAFGYKKSRMSGYSQTASRQFAHVAGYSGSLLGGGLLGGITMSGSRNQDKRRGFNATRGNKINSSGF